MYIAYSLRGPRRRGIAFADMGPFVGQLLLKIFDRADRIYNAMKCRGYAISGIKRHGHGYGPGPFGPKDAAYLAIVAVPCIALRLFDVYSMAKSWARQLTIDNAQLRIDNDDLLAGRPIVNCQFIALAQP
jgi:cobalt/nickel transport system permease protein